jgi:hypothetical protein
MLKNEIEKKTDKIGIKNNSDQLESSRQTRDSGHEMRITS